MIQHKTAREMMYSWHGGQSSALYAAASSGLVVSMVALSDEILKIGEPDRGRLMSWLQRRSMVAPEVVVVGRTYRVLPWISRSYFPKGL